MNGRGKVTQVINDQNFSKFSEMHRLMLEGKYDEANKIREELGLKQISSDKSNGAQRNRGWRNGGRHMMQ
jgi:hypothetical protein